SVALALMPLVITWVCDTCAMAAGALVGGRQLAPVLSPRKTWGGAVGGLVGGLAAALLYGLLILDRVALHLGVVQLATVGVAGLVNGGSREQGAGSGPSCLVEAATRPDVEIVVNAIVGAAGLEATLAALSAGKRVALANKETLVMAGELVTRTAREGGGEIVPVDSEHSAVLQCITGRRPG